MDQDEKKSPYLKPSNFQLMRTMNSGIDGQFHPMHSELDYGEHDRTFHRLSRNVYSNTSKRSRSPLTFSDHALELTSYQIDSERERQAKAKRLTRFKVELSEPILQGQDMIKPSSTRKVGNDNPRGGLPMGNGHLDFSGVVFDSEVFEPSDAVIGLCPDMCPESEREERERKGDLDKYERLNGERNQTTKSLAVKKYNRTAERVADLIRPLPVLQKTVHYLLGLLDRPYSDNFLGIYNFLWDRMRAIRMDLRMQHIFNQDAITMLEQMIRLHIISMHELCEYEKGEGFSEGFDAHLNIEQMNKTSVELFQIYDDHRRKGICVPTEQEFRGYYALLKLDRHPGYKVEPAELSLELAKMEPAMRCTPDILFARDVARACRTGNYIAFFRLARKATYLQACLMHAHFVKVRKQALASLHAGLQYNQGVPVQLVIKWLCMEGEDIETLLEYHGFVLRKYEDFYVVKEGPLLNIDVDFPTKCSLLVHQKKSGKMFDDVYQSRLCRRKDENNSLNVVTVADQGNITSEIEENVFEEEMLDHSIQIDQMQEVPLRPILHKENSFKVKEVPLPRNSSTLPDIFFKEPEQQENEGMVDVPEEGMLSPKPNRQIIHLGTSVFKYSDLIINEGPMKCLDRNIEDLEITNRVEHEEKVSNTVLRSIVRKWRQQTLLRRQMREQKLFLTTSALSSLSLGPPLRLMGDESSHSIGKLGIDFARRERYRRYCQSWTRLNVSDLTSEILSARNPNSKCICWKLVLHVHADTALSHDYELLSEWLQRKLLPPAIENDDELLVSSSYLSIWRKWLLTESGSCEICCLSIVRKATFDKNGVISDDVTSGASGIIFIASETIPWETQSGQLKKLLTSIPSGSSLPLLVISSWEHKELTDYFVSIVQKYGLHESRINIVSSVFLKEHGHVDGFFVDDPLREGLQWMATASPIQPTVYPVKVRELLSKKLSRSLETLRSRSAFEVGPEPCISAFNKALTDVAEDISAAASLNPNHWPCPEIEMLDKISKEQKMALESLPRTGWSSITRIRPLLDTLRDSALPKFTEDISWINQGSKMSQQVDKIKFAIENCLMDYLTRASQLLTRDLASKEVDFMLQKGATLELCGTSYYIVPKWSFIFQRIYNWKLMKLTTCLGGEEVYVLNSYPPVTLEVDTSSGVRDYPYLLSRELSLDEILQMLPDEPAAYVPHHLAPSSAFNSTICNYSFEEPAKKLATENRETTSAITSAMPSKCQDKLSLLLERCHSIQDMIDKKLKLDY